MLIDTVHADFYLKKLPSVSGNLSFLLLEATNNQL